MRPHTGLGPTPSGAVAVAATALVVLGLALVLAGCSSSPTSNRKARAARALHAYLNSIEPLRQGVNELLDAADPILAGYHDHRLTGQQAADQMGDLERRFAGFAVQVAAIRPTDPTLAQITAPYAHTYILEDSYLSALVAALPDGDFEDLPNTQSEQRAAIIEWRTKLQVFADQAGTTLPADLQQAGRGEIAPSPTGS